MLSYPSPHWPGFLRSILGQSLFTKRGIFQLPFSHLTFSAQRGHFRSNNSKGVNFFLGGGGGGGVSVPTKKIWVLAFES